MADWWPQASQQGLASSSNASPGGPFTPTRPLAFAAHTPLAHRQTRFNIADELDPEDTRMAEQIKFAPTFAASPAGKAILGTGGGGALSPGANGPGSVGAGGQTGGGGNSPPGGSARAGRSPNARFAAAENAASPRNPRHNKAMAHQMPEEDMPPTASLRDMSDSPARPSASMPGPAQLPLPQSLIPTDNTTTLIIFGPPAERLHELQPYLAAIGPIRSYRPGPDGTNWWVVEYEQPLSAAYALRRHGELLHGKWMLGVRVSDGIVSSAGGWGGGNTGAGGGEQYRAPGREMAVQKGQNVMRAKQANGDKRVEGGWDNTEEESTYGRVAGWLFGR